MSVLEVLDKQRSIAQPNFNRWFISPAALAGSILLFNIDFSLIVSMYSGGFAIIPAYLHNMFGTMEVGAIHGRVLTAWSVAGVLDLVLMNYICKYQINSGVLKAQAYTFTICMMLGILFIGFIANLLVTEVNRKYYYNKPLGELQG